jgi:hypothetical protein
MRLLDDAALHELGEQRLERAVRGGVLLALALLAPLAAAAGFFATLFLACVGEAIGQSNVLPVKR